MSRTDANSASRKNAIRGRDVELESSSRFPIVLADDDASPDWYDGVVVETVGHIEPATPVEIKGCLDELDTPKSRSGRWWIQRANHETLVACGGAYCLAVYDDAGDVQRCSLLPAGWVDTMLEDRWTPCGNRVRVDECAQLPWTELFLSLEEPHDG